MSPESAVHTDSEAYTLGGEWTFDRPAGTLSRADEVSRLEPKVADLLAFLVDRPGAVISREELTAELWGDVVVGDDALPRSVSKLRKALGDDPKAPRYVETVPKRGYRWIAGPPTALETVEAVDPAGESTDAPEPSRRKPGRAAVLVGLVLLLAGAGLLLRDDAESPSAEPSAAEALSEQAKDFYSQVDRAGNESAIELYERALAVDPELASAHAGLANALVQRVLRYPTEDVPPIEPVNLGNALASGRLETAEARLSLDRAQGLAERAVRLAPDAAASHKALGFVLSALGRRDEAIRTYERALELDADAWDVLINLGDLHEIGGDPETGLAYFERAYEAMTRVYDEQAARIRPWYAEMGVAIGIRHQRADRPGDAEAWYRRVLGYAPFHPPATCALSRLLRHAGDAPAAERQLEELQKRTGEPVDCARELAAFDG